MASVLAVIPTVEAADVVPFECSVEPADGGVLLTWTELPDAVSYQYKRDVASSGSAYQRVTGSSAFIPLSDGLVASVGLAPIFEDGSTQARTLCGQASPNDGSGPVLLTCAVTSADGGIEVTWNAVPDAVQYAWKLSIEGQSPKYRRLGGTQAFISLPDGVVGSVSMTPVFDDGSIRSRSACGSAAPNEGTGNTPFECSISSAPSGVIVSWSSLDQAVSYQYKLNIEGRGAQYRRVTGTSVLIDLAPGTVATVGLSPVFDDGSTMPRSACGTATAGGDSEPEVPVVESCGLVDAGNSVARFTWTATNTDDAETLTWRIAYTFGDPDDLGGVSGEVARSFDPAARSYDIAFQPGFTVAGTIEIEDIDGQGNSASVEVDCGEVTLADDPVDPGDNPAITDCTVTDAGADGFRIEWAAANTDGRDITWRYSYGFIQNAQDTTSDFGVDPDDGLRSVLIPASIGSFVTEAVVSFDSIDGVNGGPALGCGTAIVGGTPAGPPCFSPGLGTIDFGTSLVPGTVSYEVVVEASNGDIEVVPVIDAIGDLPVPGPPGETVEVRVRTVFDDGTRSLESDCGDVLLPDDRDQPVITDCTITDLGPEGLRIDWTAANTAGRDLIWTYSYGFNDGSGRRVNESVVSENGDLRSVTVAVPLGASAGATLRLDFTNRVPGSTFNNCGSSVVIGGTPFGPTCEINFSGFVNFDPAVPFNFVDFYEVFIEDEAGEIEVVALANSFIDIELAGTPQETLTVRVQTVYEDGSRSFESDCGQYTIPENEPIVVECSVIDVGAAGFRIDWEAEGIDGRDVTWRYTYAFIENGQDMVSTFGISEDGGIRTITIPASIGAYVTQTFILFETVNGETLIGRGRGCGGTVIGGTPSGPPCAATDPGEIGFGISLIPGTASYEVVVENAAGDIEVLALPNSFDEVAIPGQPGQVLSVRVRTVFDDGTRSLESDCGQVTIPDRGGDDPVITSCVVSDEGNGGFGIEWTADNLEGRNVTWGYRYVFLQSRPTGTTGEGTSPDDTLRSLTIPAPAGSFVSEAVVSIVAVDGVATAISSTCGVTVVGGVPAGPPCSLNDQSATVEPSLFPGGARYELAIEDEAGQIEVLGVIDISEPVTISGPPDEVVEVRATTIFADGSRSLESSCGFVYIPDSSPDDVILSSCRVVDVPGIDGVRIEWVADNTDGRDIVWGYGYQLTEPGRIFPDAESGEIAGANLRSVTISAPVGSLVEVTRFEADSVDGSFGPGLFDGCGSVVVGGVAGGPSCFTNEEAGTAGVSTFNFPNTVSYELLVEDQAGNIQVLQGLTPGNIVVVPGEVGTTATVRARTLFEDGSFSLESDCGQVIIADAPPLPVLVSCRAFDGGSGITIEWIVDGFDDRIFAFGYEYNWSEPGEVGSAGEVGFQPPEEFERDGDTFSITLGFPPGTILNRAEIVMEFGDLQRASRDCELDGAIVGGIVGGPECDAFDGQIFLGGSNYERTGFEIEYRFADGQVRTEENPSRFNSVVIPPGTPGETVSVRARATLPDGSRSLWTECGSVVVPEPVA